MIERGKLSTMLAISGTFISAVAVIGCDAKPKQQNVTLKIAGESPEEKAKFLIGHWIDSIRSHDHVSVILTHNNELTGGLGPKLKNLNLTMVHKVFLSRPNMLSLRHQSGSTGFNIVTDGTRSQTWPQPAMPRDVTIEDLPSSDLSALSLRTSLDSRSFGISTVHTPWQFLIFNDPFDFLDANFMTVSYEGVSNNDGRLAHIVRAKKAGEHIDIYFSDTDPPELLCSELYTNQSENRIGSVTFTDWRYDPIDPQVFQVPVPGAPMPPENDGAKNVNTGSNDS